MSRVVLKHAHRHLSPYLSFDVRPPSTTPVQRIALILAFLALMAVCHTVGAGWGREGKLCFAGALLVLSVAAAIFSRVTARRLARQLSLLDANQRASLMASNPEFESVFTPPKHPPWYWRVFDGLLGLTLLMAPPVWVALIRGDRVSWDSAFTGWHLLSVACGVGLYGWLHGRLQAWLNHRYELNKSPDPAQQRTTPAR